MHLVAAIWRDMRQAAGFTLIEILIVVGLVAVMAAVTVPTVAGAMDRYYINSAGQQVASTIRTARFQAVARNIRTQVNFDSPAVGQYQTEIWDGMSWDALGEVQRLSTGITFGDGIADVTLEPSGRAPACPCTIVVTDGTEENDQTIIISSSGRVQLQ